MKAKTLKTLLLTGACLMFAAPAMAQESECTTSADCENGFTCEELYTRGGACPDVFCEEGDTECMESAECDTSSEVVMGCMPPPPESCDPAAGASACSDSALVCVTYTYESCSSGGSTGSPEPGAPPERGEDEDGEMGDEEPVGEPSCMTEQESYCVPPYFAACEVDADCGGGFTCEQELECAPCAVEPSVCTEDQDGNVVCEEPEHMECDTSCQPSGRTYCELQEVSCSADADCAQGMVCETFDSPSDSVCTISSEDEDPVCEEPEPSEPVSYCLPADWERWGGHRGGGSDVDYDAPLANAGGGCGAAGRLR